jgi:toluene monooxygenase system protein A
VWFDLVVPGPKEREWLRSKYPASWDPYDAIWRNIAERWEESDVGNDFAVHGTAIVSFCDMCQLVLCGGTPKYNTAETLVHDGKKYIFCSKPCRWIFEKEPARYAAHKDVVKRVLAGEAPANLIAMLVRYFGLTHETWGKDVVGGDYPWMNRRKSP